MLCLRVQRSSRTQNESDITNRSFIFFNFRIIIGNCYKLGCGFIKTIIIVFLKLSSEYLLVSYLFGNSTNDNMQRISFPLNISLLHLYYRFFLLVVSIVFLEKHYRNYILQDLFSLV